MARDGQTIAMITLVAIGFALTMLFLDIPRAGWIGAAGGFFAGTAWYWWADTYDQVHPADRMFEFVILTFWCSILAGFVAFIAMAILRRTK